MQRCWFLSYNTQDLGLMQGFEAAFKRKDDTAKTFFAPNSLRAGGFWMPALAAAIAEASAFVLLVGQKGLGPWQVIEYYEALDRHVKDPNFPVLLVLLDGEPAPGLPFLRQLHWIVAVDPTSEKAVAQVLNAAGGTGALPGELWRHTAPYRGLAAMTESDSDFFFGRGRETVEVIKALAAKPDRLPLLLGNSGVGKSSLAQAGVLAALMRQGWPETAAETGAWPSAFASSRRWCVLSLKPGTEPVRSLVEPFLRTWQFDATDPDRAALQSKWIGNLLDGAVRLRDLLDATELRYSEELRQPKPTAFLLYVDQGEELYVRAEERGRRRFSDILAEGLADPRLYGLMSLRADFFGDLQGDEPLYGVHRQINVPPLRESELRDVVSRPAAQLSARFETQDLASDLARRTAEESTMDAGALPLLSYLLDDMWRRMIQQGDGVLRLPADSIDLGRVLVDRANVFISSHPNAEDKLRGIFTLKLATVREDGEPTRRRAWRSEFSEDEWRLVSDLANHPYRLLVTGTAEATAIAPTRGPATVDSKAAAKPAETFTEIAHEAIFRRWDKLREWIAAEREFLSWRSGLEAARRAWQAAPEQSKTDALLMGLALAQAQSWLTRRAGDLPAADREFITLSLQREEAERRQRELVRRRVFGSAIAAFVVVTGLAIFSFVQWREAEHERDRAEQALANVPKTAVAYFSRGLAYLAKEDYVHSVQDFDEGLKLDPTQPVGYQGRGVARYKMQDYDRALADFDEGLKIDPSNADLYQDRGDAYQAKGDTDRAFADYDQAISLNPKHVGAHKGRGDLFTARGDLALAIENYDAALKVDPRNIDAYKARGNAYRLKSDYGRAIADYDQALKLDPKNAATYNDRGNVYLDERAYDRAAADYEQALKLNPTYAIAYSNRGLAYANQGQLDRAIADYNLALKFDPKNSLAYNNRGFAYANQGQYDRAIADYDQAIKLDPKSVLAYGNRANAYVVKGDGARAIANFNELLRLQPANAVAYWSRALTELYSDQAAAAVDDFATAVRLAPDAPYSVIWLHIARTRAGQDDKDEFAANAAKLDHTAWPFPVVAMLLDTMTPENVRAAAGGSGNSDINRNQACEADFFIGLYQAAHGARADAKRSFQSAAEACPTSLTASGAKLELARLR